MLDKLPHRVRLILPAFARLGLLALAAIVVALIFGERAALWFGAIALGLYAAAHLFYLAALGHWLEHLQNVGGVLLALDQAQGGAGLGFGLAQGRHGGGGLFSIGRRARGETDRLPGDLLDLIQPALRGGDRLARLTPAAQPDEGFELADQGLGALELGQHRADPGVELGPLAVERLATKDIRASAQGLIIFATNGVGMLLGSLLAGRVYDWFALPEGGRNWTMIFLIPIIITVIAAAVFMAMFHEKRYQEDSERIEREATGAAS